ncbi:MAG: hypothetical protein KDI79_19190 [Anaerolineae bacterium]|nr:hypothetical protein [Anaerolineae bacterium]
MRIITPNEIEQAAWEGRLEPLGQTYKGGDVQARVTLGEPAWWSAEEALESQTGRQWTFPADDRRYSLLRLACTLHPLTEARARYSEATLTAYLRPVQGSQPVVAHDLYPTRLTAETTGKLTLSLGPELKFAKAIEAKVGSAGVEIDYRQVFPVIQSYGLSESRPYWHFSHHASQPLLGSQFVYLVLAAPAEAHGARLSLELTATVETRFGPIRLAPPQAAMDSLSWRIGA